MSTLSGNASKGEKGKKFQQLKINLCTANKPSEPEQHQHKSSIQRKQHGMTPLGKVPTARRPTILPSEKSEHSGNDQSVNLVPSGGAGWGNKQSETGATTTPSLVQNQNPPISAPVNNVPMTGASQPVPHAQHYATSRMPPLSQVGHVPVHHGHADIKTWAMMTQGGDSSTPNFLTPQSPLFQHEFPSLSASSDTSSVSTPTSTTATQKSPTNATVDSQYGPGPSLRPQTEGSWIQGGSRPQGSTVPTTGSASVSPPAPVHPLGPPYPPLTGPDGARNNSAPSGVGVVPGGPYPPALPQQHMIPPQYSGIMPPFMLRNSYPGGFSSNFQPLLKGIGPRPHFGPYPPSDRFVPQSGTGANSCKRVYDDEDVKIRSIIKEEDLNQMATIGNDIGWAGNEDIDYNQKLKFSDDEDDDKNNRSKTRSKIQISPKTYDNPTDKNETEKENDLKTSKESSKEREKTFSSDIRNQEIRNAWMRRPPAIAPPTSASRYQIPSGRFEEDDEAWQEKRRQKKEEMEIIMQRAKERKEEEEKRFFEQQQAAQLKLKKLEATMFANSANKENKGNSNERNTDMLPEWEKEKLKAQNKGSSENQASDDVRNTQNAVPVPVVKDASEFRELTQLVDRSNFVKKDTKERENSQIVFSRSFNSNIPPRFQNLNRQNSGGFSNSSSSSGLTRSNSSQQSQGSGKSGSPNFGTSRHNRLDSELFEKDRDWSQEDGRKDQDNDRYLKEVIQDREYAYDRGEDRSYENNSKKEYDSKRKYISDKDEYNNESYHREFDRERETNFCSKLSERRNSECERERSKGYDYHRYPENDVSEKESRWRQYDEMEKPSHPLESPRPARLFSESENHDDKKSREDIREIKSMNADKERDYYRKIDSCPREKSEPDRENEKNQDSYSPDYKKEMESDIKKERDYDIRREREREKKSPSPFDDRSPRNELKDGRFNRESRESLRDESYVIQEGRSYPWTENPEGEEKPKSRREHYREDRGDRYSHAQRHPPGPITRAKLEAKELESDSKRNLTALVRSDKKTEVKKSEPDEVKEKDKPEKIAVKTEVTECANSVSKSERQELTSAWKKDDKKEKEADLAAINLLVNEQISEMAEVSRKKDDDKIDAKSIPKSESIERSDDKRNDRRKNDRRNKSDPRNWIRYSMYRGNSYGGSREPRARKSNRGSAPKSSRRDSKYSESDYSDEVSGSGREDKNLRIDREKSRPVKSSSKRYDRDDRGRDLGRDYRMDDRDYGNTRGRNSRDTYYSNNKQPQRSRGVYHSGAPVNKRLDTYGSSKSQFTPSTSHVEDKRLKSSNKEVTSATDQNLTESKKMETVITGKTNTRPVIDRSWKKHYENPQENKSAVSSPASTQTAEANEESFATASEGSDSEETTLQGTKSKSSTSVTKRSTTVVVAKPQRKNFRSSSRKRYDGRRTSSYSRKDSGSYSGTKRNVANTCKTPVTGKENEKGDGGNASEYFNSNKNDVKSSEKYLVSYADAPIRKNIKPRNRSNSRKNVRSGGVSGSRIRNGQDFPPRSREKSKCFDGKMTGEAKDFKSSISVPFFKEVGPPIPAPPPAGNAWDKPLTGALRNGSPSTQKLSSTGSASGSLSGSNATSAIEKNSMQTSEQHLEQSQLSSEVSLNILPAEKVLENLDGASPPVQTIIFENTNFKNGPNDLTKSKYSSQLKNHRFEKDTKLDSFETNVANFGNASSNSELSNNKQDLQMTLFNKNEDVADMKLDFAFDTEFTKLTEDNKSKSIELTHAMHIVQDSTDAELNFKIASVKKVWDGEHNVGMVNTSASFSPSFNNHSSDPNNSCYGNSHIENTGHVQVEDVALGHNEVVFSNVSQMQAVNSSYGSSSNCQTVVIKNDATSSSSNVCKVKPQPQGSNLGNIPQSAVISTTLASHPPPMSSPSYNSFSCSTPQPNLNSNAVAATALAQMGFQQYSSMPPVPSSPVLFNSSQTGTAAPGLYQAFQIDNTQVAARSAFSQFSSYGLTGALGQASAFNQQSVFVQPPTNAPPPEIYPQQVPQYRLPPQAFGNTQQITSQNTVLISSSSNSLMSASIKPSNQQISVIGTKTGPSSQIFMPVEHATQLLSQNFLPGGQLLQRPGSNVVPGPSLQASTSYYSSASGTGQTGFFTPGTNSTLQPQPGPAIGLPMFNAPSASQSLGPNLQNFNSQLTQQYRSTPTSYLTKTGNTSSITSDYGGNKTITIPNQHDVLNQAFQSNSQAASNKQRMQSGGKNVSTVPQGVAQHTMSQNAYSYQAPNQMRNNGGTNKGSQYPHPIQRPVSQGNNSNRAGNNTSNNSASHRMPVRNNSHQLVNSIQQPPSSVYYSASSGFSTNSSKLEASQLDTKADSSTDSKLADSIKTINAKNTSTAEKNSTSNE